MSYICMYIITLDASENFQVIFLYANISGSFLVFISDTKVSFNYPC